MNRFYAALGSILVLSASIRFYQLGLSSYWIDEMVSMHFAKHPYWQSVFWDNNPIFYHALLKGWVRLFGDTEFASRTLSVLFSIGSTAMMMRIGFLLRERPGALLFGFLHAISVLSVLYAQETRMYAMFEFFMTLHFYFFLRLMSTGKGLKFFTISAVLMSFTHYLAIIPLAIEGFFLYRQKNISTEKKKLLASLIPPFAVEVASYLYFFKWEGLKWQSLKYSVEPYSILPIDLSKDFSNRSWIYGLIFFSVLIAGTFLFKKEKSKKDSTVLYFATLVLAPIIGMFFAALIFKRSVFLSRYYIYMVPVLICWFSVMFLDFPNFKKQYLKPAVLVLMFAVTAYSLFTSVYIPYKEPWRDVSQVVMRFPASLILTTRTVAIGTPYFEKTGAEVKKWNPLQEDGVDFLKKEVAARKRVWVIENYWGGYPYMANLGERLKSEHYGVSELSLRTDYSSPVLVMLVEAQPEGVKLR